MSNVPSKQKLVLCFVGIFVSYFIYGLLQEKITKGRYGDGGERFTFTLALVFAQCLVNMAFAQIAISLYKPGPDTAPQTMYALMSSSYLGAMLSSNHALQYVSYPTQVLGKSAKPIPVMILGVLVGRKRYPLLKYLFVMLIVVGVALFMYKDKKAAALDADHTFGAGELLLVLSLTLDGITGGVQDRMRASHVTQTHRMMFYMNLWSSLYLAVALVVTGEAMAFVVFAVKFPVVLFNLLSFSLCSALGQNFIFMTVTTFGPLLCSIFTTTRKFFTILASVIIFAHPMSSRQWLGTAFVFLGLGLDSVFGKGNKGKK